MGYKSLNLPMLMALQGAGGGLAQGLSGMAQHRDEEDRLRATTENQRAIRAMEEARLKLEQEKASHDMEDRETLRAQQAKNAWLQNYEKNNIGFANPDQAYEYSRGKHTEPGQAPIDVGIGSFHSQFNPGKEAQNDMHLSGGDIDRTSRAMRAGNVNMMSIPGTEAYGGALMRGQAFSPYSWMGAQATSAGKSEDSFADDYAAAQRNIAERREHAVDDKRTALKGNLTGYDDAAMRHIDEEAQRYGDEVALQTATSWARDVFGQPHYAGRHVTPQSLLGQEPMQVAPRQNPAPARAPTPRAGQPAAPQTGKNPFLPY